MLKKSYPLSYFKIQIAVENVPRPPEKYVEWHKNLLQINIADCIIFKKKFMAKYSKGAQDKVEKVMKEKKRGTLKSGRSGKKVTSRKQAIAIGLSEARKAGAKVPKKKS